MLDYENELFMFENLNIFYVLFLLEDAYFLKVKSDSLISSFIIDNEVFDIIGVFFKNDFFLLVIVFLAFDFLDFYFTFFLFKIFSLLLLFNLFITILSFGFFAS